MLITNGRSRPGTLERGVDIVELIIVALRKKRDQLLALFAGGGQLIIHVKPGAPDPVQLEAHIKV